MTLMNRNQGRNSNKRRAVTASVLVAVALVGGCHVQLGTPAVSKDKLAADVKQKLEAQKGAKADSVVCNGDLPAKVGATQRCVLTAGGGKIGITVTTTGVNGDDIKYELQVDDKPMS